MILNHGLMIFINFRNADAVRGYIKKRMLSEEDKLQKLERQINPLLDDNDQNQLTFTLRKIIDKFLQIESKRFFIYENKLFF